VSVGGAVTASRLADALSAYLRSAAHQPVAWYAWGPEPFERARAEAKPVLLDIGAVWCHWCHVMDTESYEDPRVAEALNRDWICIKVDRDERPDVDARYQRAVQALTGQGGWPLTAFLTPGGEAFYGGTYFPPEGRQDRPGFLSVLTELRRVFHESPQRIQEQAAEIRRHLTTSRDAARPGPVSPDTLSRAADGIARAFDFRYGGFGVQPKFPHAGVCEFLLGRWYDSGDRWAAEIVHRTLTAMASGGIYDQIGGGFHRYAVDARWTVPHFEKMTCDNAELLRAYTRAAAARELKGARADAPAPFDAPAVYHRVLRGTSDWVLEVLAQPQGGYAASQDADAGPQDDGDYFTWTPEEVRGVVTEDEFTALSRHYDIDDAGEMHHNPAKNVLWVRQSPREIAAAVGWGVERVEQLLITGRAKLKAARARRRRPVVDDTVYVGWSAMMAGALLDVAVLLDRPELERHAVLTLERLFREAAGGGGARGARHALGGPDLRLLDDQVHLAAAALDAYEATGAPVWRARAEALAHYAWHTFRAADGGLLDTPADPNALGFLADPLTPVHDAPTPSGNGVAALVFARIARHSTEPVWRARLDQLLTSFGGGLAELGLHGATALKAADWYLNEAAQVVVVAETGDPAGEALARAARRAYHPRKVIAWLRPASAMDAAPAAVRGMLDGQSPRAYVCAGSRCLPPVDRPDHVAAALAELAG
jgi:uncharacterized protein YyaL (SSP411 family)